MTETHGSLSTYELLDELFNATDLNGLRFTEICKLYELRGVSDAAMSRAMQRRAFSNETDERVRPLVLKLRNLVAKVHPLMVSFKDPAKVKSLLDAIDDGTLFIIEPIPLKKN